MFCADTFQIFDDAASLLHARLRFPLAVHVLTFKQLPQAVEACKSSRQGIWTRNVKLKYTEGSKK